MHERVKERDLPEEVYEKSRQCRQAEPLIGVPADLDRARERIHRNALPKPFGKVVSQLTLRVNGAGPSAATIGTAMVSDPAAIKLPARGQFIGPIEPLAASGRHVKTRSTCVTRRHGPPSMAKRWTPLPSGLEGRLPS